MSEQRDTDESATDRQQAAALWLAVVWLQLEKNHP